jgi:hypothetical protein
MVEGTRRPVDGWREGTLSKAFASETLLKARFLRPRHPTKRLRTGYLTQAGQ